MNSESKLSHTFPLTHLLFNLKWNNILIRFAEWDNVCIINNYWTNPVDKFHLSGAFRWWSFLTYVIADIIYNRSRQIGIQFGLCFTSRRTCLQHIIIIYRKWITHEINSHVFATDVHTSVRGLHMQSGIWLLYPNGVSPFSVLSNFFSNAKRYIFRL